MYQTDTLTLAAYLVSQGYTLKEQKHYQVITDNGNSTKLRDRTIFSFINDDGIEDCAVDFRNGNAFGNVNKYELARRELLADARA